MSSTGHLLFKSLVDGSRNGRGFLAASLNIYVCTFWCIESIWPRFMYDRGGLSLPLTLGFALLCQHTARNAQPKGRRRRRRRENVIQPLLYTVGRCDKHSRLIFFRIQFRSASFLFPLVLSSSSLVGLHFSALRDDKKRERESERRSNGVGNKKGIGSPDGSKRRRPQQCVIRIYSAYDVPLEEKETKLSASDSTKKLPRLYLFISRRAGRQNGL